MNIPHFSERIEIAFWTRVIPLLKSSPGMRSLIWGVYQTYDFSIRFLQQANDLIFAFWLSVAGIVLGFIIGMLFVALQ